MESNFQRSLSLVLKSEGGWSDNPADPGGATMKGVTLANFRRYVKADGTKADLRAITDAQVATVYRQFYWNVVKGDDLPSGVDYAVFDFAVNSGPSRAARYLQSVVGAASDGQIGPATVAAAKAMSASQIVNALCDKRLAFLRGLATWNTFGKGWASRVASVRAEAIKMATSAPSAPAGAPSAPAAPTSPPMAKPAPSKPVAPKAAAGGAIIVATGIVAYFDHIRDWFVHLFHIVF